MATRDVWHDQFISTYRLRPLLLCCLVSCTPESTPPDDPPQVEPYEVLIDGECPTAEIDAAWDEMAHEGQLFAYERPDLLSMFVSLEDLRGHIDAQRSAAEQSPEHPFLKSAVECSHFQMEHADVRLYEEGELIATVELALDAGMPLNFGLALGLEAVKTGKTDCQVTWRLVTALSEQLALEISDPSSSLQQARALHAYLYFTLLFRTARDADLLAEAVNTRFPGGEVQIPAGGLGLELILDIDSALRLETPLPPSLDELLETNWTGTGYRFSDCPEDDAVCQLKAFQVLGLVETSADILDEDRMVTMTSYVLGRIQNDGAFGHALDFGLSPDAFWNQVTCDWTCSPNHWAVIAALNTFFGRLEHRLDDISAEIENWQTSP